jgi:hypothetical protein
MKIYHGSDKLNGLPTFGAGKATNDYGIAFYCTENKDLAKEWACPTNENNGIVNEYEISLKNLKIIDLSKKPYGVLNWIAVLLKFRKFDLNNAVSIAARDFIIAQYYVDVSLYDVVIGYRADDSYFQYAQDFVKNTISVEKLSLAMELGHLGKQIALISQKAFDKLVFVSSETVDKNIYYVSRMHRDIRAREDYSKMKSEIDNATNETYIIDLMRKKN